MIINPQMIKAHSNIADNEISIIKVFCDIKMPPDVCRDKIKRQKGSVG